jgi:pyruvate/2-oxoglutarate dehydrogenase complex dihydrolipoamide acyltransferase (E2) component
MPNRNLEEKTDLSNFRRIAIGTWQHAYDPSVYGMMEVRMDAALDYIAKFRAQHGRRLTVSHLVAKAIAVALDEVPDANSVLRFNRVYLRKDIGVFFQVAMTDQGSDKIDLSGATVYGVHRMSLLEILDDFENKVNKVRKREDPALEKTRETFQAVPNMFLNGFLKTLSFLTHDLNLDLTFAGVPKDPFGSIMVTNIGSLGLDVAFVPLVPYSGVPILIALGAVKEQPVVDDGALAVGKVMNVCATFDHRCIDGMHAAMLSNVVRQHLESPFEHYDPLEDV